MKNKFFNYFFLFNTLLYSIEPKKSNYENFTSHLKFDGLTASFNGKEIIDLPMDFNIDFNFNNIDILNGFNYCVLAFGKSGYMFIGDSSHHISVLYPFGMINSSLSFFIGLKVIVSSHISFLNNFPIKFHFYCGYNNGVYISAALSGFFEINNKWDFSIGPKFGNCKPAFVSWFQKNNDFLNKKINEIVANFPLEAQDPLARSLKNNYLNVKNSISNDSPQKAYRATLVGPSGCGKTYASSMAIYNLKELDLIGFQESLNGVVSGTFVGRLLQSIWDKAANKEGTTKENFANSVFIFDEIDKVGLAAKTDPARAEALNSLLTVLDKGQKITTEKFGDVNTDNMIFIFLGSFSMLQDPQDKFIQYKSFFNDALNLNDFDELRVRLSPLFNEDSNNLTIKFDEYFEYLIIDIYILNTYISLVQAKLILEDLHFQFERLQNIAETTTLLKELINEKAGQLKLNKNTQHDTKELNNISRLLLASNTVYESNHFFVDFCKILEGLDAGPKALKDLIVKENILSIDFLNRAPIFQFKQLQVDVKEFNKFLILKLSERQDENIVFESNLKEILENIHSNFLNIYISKNSYFREARGINNLIETKIVPNLSCEKFLNPLSYDYEDPSYIEGDNLNNLYNLIVELNDANQNNEINSLKNPNSLPNKLKIISEFFRFKEEKERTNYFWQYFTKESEYSYVNNELSDYFINLIKCKRNLEKYDALLQQNLLNEQIHHDSINNYLNSEKEKIEQLTLNPKFQNKKAIFNNIIDKLIEFDQNYINFQNTQRHEDFKCKRGKID